MHDERRWREDEEGGADIVADVWLLDVGDETCVG
jgi:hypothetical protein